MLKLSSIILITVLLFSCLTTTTPAVSTPVAEISQDYSDTTAQVLTEPASETFKSVISQHTVQVVLPSAENLTGTESAWLPGQIQDKLKSNLQDYLNMRIVADTNSEKKLKQLQAESESGGRDENTAIELGKITTAKYGLFSKIRKTGSGYSISADYTDLTTGVHVASVTSKEYSKIEYLYSSTGAVDEVTLALASKLNIKLNDITRNLLDTGSPGFSVDEQLALAKQNEEQYQKLMKQYDDELKKLSVSNDLSSVENKKKIEVEKLLLEEKRKSEQKRLEDLLAQKQQAELDAKLEAERSIELKTQRDVLAKQASAKAEEVRRLKLDKQGVLGQINVIENKKKALVEIRQTVETRCFELWEQMNKDKADEEQKIRNKPYSSVELGSNRLPTVAAKNRRDNQITASKENLTNKFFTDCDNIKKAANLQETALLSEIRADQESLEKTRTVSSMGNELKVSFGSYAGEYNGWVTYISLYSDGVLLNTDSFIVGYETIVGKKAPNMETELDDAVINEYADNVDMFSSLLTRGDPIVYVELDYTVKAENDDKPSQYIFNFNTIRVINTVSGKVTQSSAINKVQQRIMIPQQDLREFAGIVAKEKVNVDPDKYRTEYFMISKCISRTEAERLIEKEEKYQKKLNELGIQMVSIPGQNFEMMNTEVTQKQYKEIMGKNPSEHKGDNLPVECVSWYEAVEFCNKASEMLGLDSVYSMDGKKVIQNTLKDGFRLPTEGEWEYAANDIMDIKRDDNYLFEVAWIGAETHPVALKKPNMYGLYDLRGNVWEWCWDIPKWRFSDDSRRLCGSSYDSDWGNGGLLGYSSGSADVHSMEVGFRMVRTVK